MGNDNKELDLVALAHAQWAATQALACALKESGALSEQALHRNLNRLEGLLAQNIPGAHGLFVGMSQSLIDVLETVPGPKG